jgi:yecA family protein
MQDSVEYAELDDALRHCGANWNAALTHGFLCSRLALSGADAASEWLALVLEGSDPEGASRGACEERLRGLFHATRKVLAERQSEFMPLLPDDTSPASVRAKALADWCEGYLHGLVAARHGEQVKSKLASEPVSDIIRDLLEITRATVDGEARDESNEEAYAELVEYIRVAAQLVYEELAEFRSPPGSAAGDVLNPRR